MSKPAPPNFTKFSFFKTYVLPALMLFVIPVFSFWFFRHVQADYDQKVLESIEKSINADTQATEQQRAEAREFFRKVPMSRILATDHPELEGARSSITSEARFHYATFRWMIRLSAFSILSGIGVFIVAGLSVYYSLRSQLAQYYSLSVGWHVLRAFATMQVLVQGCLAVALSFWVTAFWAEMYSMKLIIVAVVLAIGAGGAVIGAIFKKIDDQFVLEGALIERGPESPLWNDLDRICAAVGTQPPDRIVAGIDNNFFVTEHAVTVNGKVHEGRTLYVSLSLLKVMQGTQADAVMAHEMAHFSGNDTMYSRKISPLLNRYEVYLQALHAGGLSLPVFYFMLCFRSLYQISLSKLRREREFRADQIAAQTTSSRDIANSLLIIGAYSEYRGKVEQILFNTEHVLDRLNISQRLGTGFKEFASSFMNEGKINQSEAVHPFDSHPPFHQRIEAVKVTLTNDEMLRVLQETPDGRWYRNIGKAEELEQQQWSAYEERFRQVHEQVLAYRYIPETEAEIALVVKYFPTFTFSDSKNNQLTIDYEQISYGAWDNPILFGEITGCAGDQSALGHPQINFEFQREDEKCKRTLRIDIFREGQQAVINAFNHHYSRQMAMREYHKEKRESAEGKKAD